MEKGFVVRNKSLIALLSGNNLISEFNDRRILKNLKKLIK